MMSLMTPYQSRVSLVKTPYQLSHKLHVLCMLSYCCTVLPRPPKLLQSYVSLQLASVFEGVPPIRIRMQLHAQSPIAQTQVWACETSTCSNIHEMPGLGLCMCMPAGLCCWLCLLYRVVSAELHLHYNYTFCMCKHTHPGGQKPMLTIYTFSELYSQRSPKIKGQIQDG